MYMALKIAWIRVTIAVQLYCIFTFGCAHYHVESLSEKQFLKNSMALRCRSASGGDAVLICASFSRLAGVQLRRFDHHRSSFVFQQPEAASSSECSA